MSLTQEQRHNAIESLKEHGTMLMAAKAAGVDPKTLRTEMKRSPYFRKQIEDARDSGRAEIGDKARNVIQELAFGKHTEPKIKLTAALSLANAYEPGFKAVTRTEGRIDHNIHVMTAIPRPRYDVIDTPEVKQLPPVDQQRLAYNA